MSDRMALRLVRLFQLALPLVLIVAAIDAQPHDPRICGTVVPDCPTFEATMSQLFREADCLAPPDVAKTIDDTAKLRGLVRFGAGRQAAAKRVREWATRCGYRPLEPSTAVVPHVLRGG